MNKKKKEQQKKEVKKTEKKAANQTTKNQAIAEKFKEKARGIRKASEAPKKTCPSIKLPALPPYPNPQPVQIPDWLHPCRHGVSEHYKQLNWNFWKQQQSQNRDPTKNDTPPGVQKPYADAKVGFWPANRTQEAAQIAAEALY